MTHTWITKSHKVTKALVVEFIFLIYVVTFILVMTKRMNGIPTLVIINNRFRLNCEVSRLIQRTMLIVVQH